ncbi:MAG TPA: hypothetical protein VGK73_14770 [Polyangiaceae bacterium]
MPEWFFLAQDNSCHWYCVPTSKREEWEAWCDIPEDDERSWNEPDYARRLDGGPEQVEFQNPKGGGL